MNKRILIWGVLITAMALVVFIMMRVVDNEKIYEPLEDSDRVDADYEILDVKKYDWVKGNPDAKLVIVKYSDFKCPACRIYASFDANLNNELGEEVLFVFRHFPLSNSEVSMQAARFAEAAGQQGKFWEMHDLIYINQHLWKNNLPESVFYRFATFLKLDPKQLSKDLRDPLLTEKIQRDYMEGQKLGVRSVPSIFINGKKISIPNSIDAYRKLIEEQL